MDARRDIARAIAEFATAAAAKHRGMQDRNVQICVIHDVVALFNRRVRDGWTTPAGEKITIAGVHDRCLCAWGLKHALWLVGEYDPEVFARCTIHQFMIYLTGKLGDAEPIPCDHEPLEPVGSTEDLFVVQ